MHSLEEWEKIAAQGFGGEEERWYWNNQAVLWALMACNPAPTGVDNAKDEE